MNTTGLITMGAKSNTHYGALRNTSLRPETNTNGSGRISRLFLLLCHIRIRSVKACGSPLFLLSLVPSHARLSTPLFWRIDVTRLELFSRNPRKQSGNAGTILNSKRARRHPTPACLSTTKTMRRGAWPCPVINFNSNGRTIHDKSQGHQLR